MGSGEVTRAGASEPKNVVYGLHNGDGVIRYVGKTVTGAAHRLTEHRWKSNKKDQSKATAVNRWMQKHGVDTIQYTLLAASADPHALNALEVEWIALLRAAGNDLMNHTDGGEGVLGHRHTEAHKAHMSALLTGRLVSLETSARISRAKKGVPNPNYPKTLGPMGAEHKAKLSAALKGRPKPEGHGAKVALAVRGSGHGMSKLTEPQVVEIIARIQGAEPDALIAKDFGVNGHQIGKIRRGERWAHVPRNG